MTQVYLLELFNAACQNFLSLNEAKLAGLELIRTTGQVIPSGWLLEYRKQQDGWELNLITPDRARLRYTAVVVRQVDLEDPS